MQHAVVTLFCDARGGVLLEGLPRKGGGGRVGICSRGRAWAQRVAQTQGWDTDRRRCRCKRSISKLTNRFTRHTIVNDELNI